jgi:DNA polymerase-1
MKLLVLDGYSLAFRAFFALPTDLATASGTVTNAVYGFTSMLTKVLADEQPDLVGVAFDAPGPTFRDALDPEYKAGRAETPDLFRSQLPLIREVLDALQIQVVEEPGVEADDVIATLAEEAKGEGIDVVIVTGDRDSYQLVEDPHVRVLYNKRGVSDYALYDEAGIFERCGVTPAQYPDYAALRGDSSDNLPGVPGIGEKTAAKLVTTYGDLEGIYEHVDALPPKQRENLGECRDRVFKNREMTVLRRDVPLDVHVRDLHQGAFDREALRVLFNQLEFKTLLPRTLAAVGATAEPAPVTAALDVETVVLTDPARAAEQLGRVRNAARIALEPRWEGVAARSRLVGLAIGTDGGVWYLTGETLDAPVVREALAALVGAGGVALVAHRAKELMHGLAGIDVRSLDADTAVMAYLLDPGEGKYLLDDLALRYLSVELVSPDSEAGTLDLEGERAVDDTGRRAAAVLRLADSLYEALDARELRDLYERFERPLVRVLQRMERAGVKIDVAFLEELRSELTDQCRDLERRIHAHAGEPFNVNSTPQLRKVLFDQLGLTPVKKTKTGPSTDADSLQKMVDAHPIVEDLLRYREVEKLRSTYAEALPPLVQDDGRIHATFNQIATTTGRISSESPNLQNVPVRTAGGREMRRAFVAEEGCGLLTADYSQIELRVLAHLADDPGLIDAFERGADVHTATAAKVFGVDEGSVDEFQRRFAKVVNYGLAYGMEAYGLAQRLDIPTDQAREILDAYFEGFPNVHAYMQATVREAKDRGYTTTLFGRRRQLPELASDNFRIRQMGERMAQNAPVQGSAADIFKLAMIGLDDALESRDLASRMVLTVHDELVLEVPEAEHAPVEALVRDVMEHVAELRVPLVVDVGFGPTWAEAK